MQILLQKVLKASSPLINFTGITLIILSGYIGIIIGSKQPEIFQ